MLGVHPRSSLVFEEELITHQGVRGGLEQQIFLVAGARPNFMKVAPLVEAFRARRDQFPELEPLLVHTCQHYDARMSDEFFHDLARPTPDIRLGAAAVPRYDENTRRRVLDKLDQPPPAGHSSWTGALLAMALGDVSTDQVWRVLRTQGID